MRKSTAQRSSILAYSLPLSPPYFSSSLSLSVYDYTDEYSKRRTNCRLACPCVVALMLLKQIYHSQARLFIDPSSSCPHFDLTRESATVETGSLARCTREKRDEPLSPRSENKAGNSRPRVTQNFRFCLFFFFF